MELQDEILYVVMVPGWFRLIGEVLKVRNKFSAKFFVFRPFLSTSVSLYEMKCVF